MQEHPQMCDDVNLYIEEMNEYLMFELHDTFFDKVRLIYE